MSLVILLVDAIIAAALLLIGAAILLRNHRAVANRLYFGMTMFAALWIVSNYLSNDLSISFSVAVLANHFVLLFPGLVLVSFLLFVTHLGVQKPSSNSINTLALGLTGVYLLSLTPLVVRGIHKEGSLYAIHFGVLAPLYFLAVLINVGVGFYILFRKQRHVDKVERQKNQIIFWSFLATIVVNLVTNVALPYLHGAFLLTNIGPLSAVFIVGGSAYAILKHHLFDIRFFVVRAAAYGFTIVLIGLFYLMPAVWLLARLAHVHLSGLTFIVLSAASLLLTVAYKYLRRIFDQLTKRIFYRHYYDPQDVLDELGDLLAHTIDITRLQKGSQQIIVDALNVSLLEYQLDITGAETLPLASLFSHAKSQSVVVLDEITGHQTLLAEFRSKGVAVVVRLRTTHGELGYMLLGFKKSGEPYSQKDKRLLSTIADEIAISMQNALHFKEIQAFNETLQERVNKATTELRRTNEKLKLLDETKDEFITMASHQLRTPLTSVKGYLSMVLEGDAGKLNANQRKLLEQSYFSAQRMVYLISDLLNLSRLNTGKFVIEATPVDLSEVVEAEVEQLAETAKSRDLKLLYNRPASFPALMLDETKIHQVVMNLIDNAIYYTPSGGTVTVGLRETDTAVEYTVKDTGIGVPKAAQHKLFTKFYRAQNAQQARPDGTGLGLFMARKVVAAQGGSILFESEEGKGSTFGFRFTKKQHLAPKA